MNVKIGLIDDNGDVINDIFPDVPVELSGRDIKDKGNFAVNATKINFGAPTRTVTVETFILTQGPGFFESCPTGSIKKGGVTIQPGNELVMDPGALEIERTLL